MLFFLRTTETTSRKYASSAAPRSSTAGRRKQIYSVAQEKLLARFGSRLPPLYFGQAG